MSEMTRGPFPLTSGEGDTGKEGGLATVGAVAASEPFLQPPRAASSPPV